MSGFVCAFTGHREIPIGDYEKVKAFTKKTVDLLISRGVTEFISGGAVGYDMLAAEIEIEAKKYCSKITKVENLMEQSEEQTAKIDIFNLRFKKFLEKLKEIPMDKYKLIQMVISKVYINSPPVDNEFDITIVYKIEEQELNYEGKQN